MKKLETLGFKHFCLTVGNLPSSYVESLSYYECLLCLIKYLQEEVIPTVNNNSEVVEELQNLYIELKTYVDNAINEYEESIDNKVESLENYMNDYFNNLDVQEEINNKLDKMVEDGTLPEIITSYLNSKAIFGFDTVADMKQATNLINGSYARTLGYYSKNDGGGATYKIRTTTNEDIVNEGNIIALSDNTLIAELIITNGEVFAEQFGTKGNGIDDDITKLNNCRNYAIANNVIMKANSSSIFGISEGFDLLTGCSYDFNLATFKALNNMSYVIKHHKENQSHIEPIKNEYTKNIIIDCDNKANYGFYQDTFGWSILVDNIRVINPLLIGIYIEVGQIRLYNSKVEQMDNTISCIGLQVDSNDSEYYNIVTRECTTGIKIIGSTNTFNECHPAIFNNTIEGSVGFDISGKNELINCYSDTFQYGIYQRSQAGFEVINFRNVINTSYYTTERVSTAPYLLYSTNDSVDWTSRITMIGCSMNTSKVYGEEYTHFSNYTKWNGSSLRLNNPQFNLNQFTTNLPKEIRQNVSQVSLSSYVSQNVTVGTGRCLVNGNCSIFQLNNVTLPNVTAGGIQYICESIPELYLGEQTIEKYITSENGVVCLLQFRTNGGISIKPVTQITAGDTLNIYEMILK